MADFKTNITGRFGNQGGGSQINGVEFNAEILTSGHWPF
jgi:hypothetical protein